MADEWPNASEPRGGIPLRGSLLRMDASCRSIAGSGVQSNVNG